MHGSGMFQSFLLLGEGPHWAYTFQFLGGFWELCLVWTLKVATRDASSTRFSMYITLHDNANFEVKTIMQLFEVCLRTPFFLVDTVF
jgi:hypothetical protein